MSIVDGDTHLYEARTTWRDHADPADRHLAMTIEDDELGYAWVCWQGRRLHLAEVHTPGRVDLIGAQRQRRLAGEPAPASYEELLPASYGDVGARLAFLDAKGIDAAVVFPNHGLIWERQLADDPRAVRANMRAHNRWMAEVVAEARGRLLGVGHLDLADPEWVREELSRCAAAGIRLAMVAPAPTGGRSLAHPDLDPVWAAFVEYGVAPVFHVGAHPRPFKDAYYDVDPDPVNAVLDSVLLWAGPAAALTTMIVFGVFERHPELRVGVVELSAWWVPHWLLHLDGGTGFIEAMQGRPHVGLRMKPSEYVQRHVRVGALAFEQPERLVDLVGEDVFMFGSDWPHAEGLVEPLRDYEAATVGLHGPAREKLYGGNVRWLAGGCD